MVNALMIKITPLDSGGFNLKKVDDKGIIDTHGELSMK
jgi:hypothetical protein